MTEPNARAPLTIAFVHPSYPHSEGTGATHSASRIVFELADRGHDVTVYCRERPPADVDFADGVSLRPLEPSGPPYHTGFQVNDALRELAADGEFDDYDVVHSYVMNTMPVLGGAITDAATVVTLNAYGAVCPKNDLRYMDREPCESNGLAKCAACSVATSPGHDEYSAPYRAASRLGYLELIRRGEGVADEIDGYHVLSPHLKETYAAFGFPRERLTVIPNLLDERFDRPHESAFEAPYDLLYVGSLDEHKGVDRLLPILESLTRQSNADDRFRLTIVGDGGDRSALEERARSAGIADAVSFTGWVPNRDLPELFARHDLFVYPGRWDEPFGRVFLEALATGTPVVASDVGSVAEIVGDGGRTTDGSVAEFVDAITELVDEGGLPKLSAGASEKIEAYRADAVLPQFEGLYERCLER